MSDDLVKNLRSKFIRKEWDLEAADRIEALERALRDLLDLCVETDDGQWVDHSGAGAIFDAAWAALNDP